ncbi:restin homolog isoform X2 [Hydra vulgaris]|uniref:Restin homolog isoform X2 n=1 Tax=Hydra vulgaris TaxID=6087 RepID=A0ABM4CXD9_HYDVU
MASYNNGSEVALKIAFQDLKKKYLKQRNELNLLRLSSSQSSNGDQSLKTSYYYEKKIEQLTKSLETKTSAYKSLESVYLKTRQSEDNLVIYIRHLEELLVKSQEKTESDQINNYKLIRDNELLASFCEAEKANGFKDFSMPSNSNSDSTLELKSLFLEDVDDYGFSDTHILKMEKKIDYLLYEKKVLQTKLQSLTKELNIEKLKNEKLLNDLASGNKTVNNVASGNKTVNSLDNQCSSSDTIFNSMKDLNEKSNLLQTILKRNSDILNKLTSKTKSNNIETKNFEYCNYNYELPPLQQINPVFLKTTDEV